MTQLSLSYRERGLVENIATIIRDPRVIRRAQAILWLDEGESAEAVAELLRVSRQTIYHWVERFHSRDHLDLLRCLSDAERSGRPTTALGIIAPLIGEVIDQDARKLGYRSTVWTARLLVEYLWDAHQIEVSQRSVSSALERLGIGWKRPRYDLSRRSSTWRQAKGG
jgi:transposase